METRHIRLGYAQTLNGKKQLLSSEINMIYMARILSRYKLLRKREFVLKNQLKTSVTLLKTKLNFFLSTLPTPPKSPVLHKPAKRENNQEEKNLSEELREIQEKLARLQ